MDSWLDDHDARTAVQNFTSQLEVVPELQTSVLNSACNFCSLDTIFVQKKKRVFPYFSKSTVAVSLPKCSLLHFVPWSSIKVQIHDHIEYVPAGAHLNLTPSHPRGILPQYEVRNKMFRNLNYTWLEVCKPCFLLAFFGKLLYS